MATRQRVPLFCPCPKQIFRFWPPFSRSRKFVSMGECESQPGLALLRDAGTPRRQCPFQGAKSRGFKCVLEDEPAIKLAVQLELSPGKAFHSSFPRVSPLRFAGREVSQSRDTTCGTRVPPASLCLAREGGKKVFAGAANRFFGGQSPSSIWSSES